MNPAKTNRIRTPRKARSHGSSDSLHRWLGLPDYCDRFSHQSQGSVCRIDNALAYPSQLIFY
ncbi:MAG TPA: hypothetical protein V6D35_07150 [Candidatus Sericytochromatia bacterium]